MLSCATTSASFFISESKEGSVNNDPSWAPIIGAEAGAGMGVVTGVGTAAVTDAASKRNNQQINTNNFYIDKKINHTLHNPSDVVISIQSFVVHNST